MKSILDVILAILMLFGLPACAPAEDQPAIDVNQPGEVTEAALRDPLPGNDHHPNVTFRAALYLK